MKQAICGAFRRFIFTAVCLVPGLVHAQPFSTNVATDVYGVAQGGAVNGIPTAQDNNDGAPDINDAVNHVQGTALGRNKDLDPLFVAGDSVWQDSGSGIVMLIGRSAGFTNNLGIYTDLGVGAATSNRLTGITGFGIDAAGTIGDPYSAAFTGLAAGTLFGWHLDADQTGTPTDYFSQPSLNPVGLDHMMTFDLPNAIGKTVYVDTGAGAMPYTFVDPYLVALEDLPFRRSTLGDDDYDDVMIVVDGLRPIPEPTTCVVWSLLGTIGLLAASRRRRTLR